MTNCPAIAVFAAWLLACAPPATAQELPTQSPRVSTYEMVVELRPDDKMVAGTQRITWTNTTSAPTSVLHWHLYINAFRDRASTLMREAGAEFRGQWRDHEFGSIQLTKIELVSESGNVDLTDQQAFAQPDDGNPKDATVLVVPLPAPVGPGETIVVETAFETVLPKAYRRTGYIPGGGFFCMHWYPKLGVLEDVGGEAVWNCHQFHANSEFYADFSVYDVSIQVPSNYKLGATGERQLDRTVDVAGTKTVVFRQEDVHDFAWVADPSFVLHRDSFGPVRAQSDEVAVAVAERMGVPVEQFDLPRTKIELLLRAEHDTTEQRSRHIEAVKLALRFFGLRYGPYPYETITVVDPGRDALGRRLGGGMEYPNLITCGTSLFPAARRPQPEGVTVHEFGHQYWYGMSANNEFEESWLDEGINTYSEGRAQWLHFGERMWLVQTSSFGVMNVAGVPGSLHPAGGITESPRIPVLTDLLGPARKSAREVGFAGTVIPDSPLIALMASQAPATYFREATFVDAWNDRRRAFATDNPDAMVRHAWEYFGRDSYVANSYTRPATLLRTLENMVGRDQWWTFMRKFHAQARFGHPTTADFTKLLAEECGSATAAFFEAAIGPGAVLDYGIGSVHPKSGFGKRKTVVIRRYGTLSADVVVRFRFEGREDPIYLQVRGDDPYPWTRFEFEDSEEGGAYGRLLEVWVDPPDAIGKPREGVGRPSGVYLLDSNLLNNGWRAVRDRQPALYRGVRLLLQAQGQLSFSGLIG